MTVPPSAPDWCKEVGPAPCTVERSLYGYYPSIGANAFFAAFFGICLLVQLVQGIRYKTWTFMIALCLGCLGEVVGYIGRIMMYNNPFDSDGFQVQIVCLVVAPALICAGIYLTLKHIVINFGTTWSRLPPVWYTRIFITGDIFSLTLQGAGGGLAATADPGSSMLDVGTNLMIAGVVFQVALLIVFGVLLTEYTMRTYKRRDQISAEAMSLFQKKSFRYFIFALIAAFTGIFIRCVYRIPELTGGWRSEIMRNEPEFIALEGVMIVISVLALTVFHPGYCFPAMCNTIGKKSKAGREKSVDEVSDVEMMSGRA